VFQEKVGAAHADRSELNRLLATLGYGDTMIVSRLDRLARSGRDILAIISTVDRHDAAFRSLGDPWADTSTPSRSLMLPVLLGQSGRPTAFVPR
jgi:DNA invertase Pin-like site-specific DNA recombinase